MTTRTLVCAALLALASFHAEAAKKKTPATPPAEQVQLADIDVDAMARAKDVGAKPTDAASTDAPPATTEETAATPAPTAESDATEATPRTDASDPATETSPTAAPAQENPGAHDAIALTPPIDAGEKRQANACESRSTALLDAASKGDFATAAKDFDAKMRSALPPEKFRETWASLSQFGALQARGQPHPSKGDGYFIVMTPLIFEHANLVAQVACGSDGRVAGFHVKPLSALQPGK